MTFSVPQYLLESTICFAILYGYVRLAMRSMASPRIQWFLWFATLACLVLPAIHLPVFPPVSQTEWLHPVVAEVGHYQSEWQKALGRITPGLSISLANTLLLLYFLGFAYRSYLWIDSLHFFFAEWQVLRSLAVIPHADQPAQPRVFAEEIWAHWQDKKKIQEGPISYFPYIHFQHFQRFWTFDWMLHFHWFQPFAWKMHQVFSDQLTILASAKNGPPPKPSRQEQRFLIGGYSLFLPLFLLFSLNVSSYLPGTAHLRYANQEFTRMAHQPFIQVADLPDEPTAYIKWGIQRLRLAPFEEGKTLRTEILHLTPNLRYLLPAVEFQVFNEGKALPHKTWEAAVLVPGASQARTFTQPQQFWSYLQGLPDAADLSIYLKVQDEEDQIWIAAATISPDGQVYQPEIGIRTLVPQLSTLRWSVPVVLQQTESSEAEFVLIWGELQIPLNKYANPDVYTGYVELDRTTFLKQIGNHIQILQGSEKLEIEELNLSFSEPGTWTWSSRENQILDIRQKNQAVIGNKDLEQIRDDLQNGDWLVLRGRAGNLYLNTVNIQISDPHSLFQPTISFHPLQEEMPLYDFQVISGVGGKSTLRLDTTLASNEKVLNLYRDPERYDIIHIPGFKTYRRLLTYDSEGFYIQAAKKYPLEEWFYEMRIPTLHTKMDHLYKLVWGDLMAAPSSNIYSYEEFQESTASDLQVFLAGEELPIKKCVVVVSPKLGDPDFAILEGNISEELRQLLAKKPIAPETSLLFSSMVTEKDGQSYMLPTGFVIQVGQERQTFSYQLQMEEVVANGPFTQHEDPGEGTYNYQGIDLPNLIAILTEHRTSRMEFIDLPPDVRLSVHFSGAGFSQSRAYEHMLNALQKKYHFRLERNELNRSHWKLQVVDPDRLEPNMLEPGVEVFERVRVFEEKGYHLLTDFSLRELAGYIEDQYGEIIEPWPHSYGKKGFVFGLDFGDFSEFQRQLENEFGLRLFESQRLFSGMVVRFMHDPS